MLIVNENDRVRKQLKGESNGTLHLPAAVRDDPTFSAMWFDALSKPIRSDDLRAMSSSSFLDVAPCVDEDKQNVSSERHFGEACLTEQPFPTGPSPMQVVSEHRFTGTTMSVCRAGNLAENTNAVRDTTAATASSLAKPSSFGISDPELPSMSPDSFELNPCSIPLAQWLHEHSDLNLTILSLLEESEDEQNEPAVLAHYHAPEGAKVYANSLLVLHPPGVKSGDDGDAASKQTSFKRPQPVLQPQVRQRTVV